MARTRAFFEANGIGRITRLVTDNGSAYRSTAFNDAVRDFVGRHQCTRPYTPRNNGKVERYNRILAEEFPYARPSHQRGATKGPTGPMAHPLQLPPTPQRHGGQPTRQQPPHPRKQRHTLIQLARLHPRRAVAGPTRIRHCPGPVGPGQWALSFWKGLDRL